MAPLHPIEWFYVILAFLTMYVLPTLALVALILVIYRMIRGVKVRDISDKGERKVAAAAAQAAGQAAREAVNGAVPVSASQASAELLRARLELALADAGLTRRERTVLLAAHGGKSLAEISEELGVARSTAGTYCSRAYEKLGASSKDGAASWIARATRGISLRERGLTDDEAETALLAAEGLTSAGIAAKLVIAEATVNSRLQKVYGKLGIHSREELAGLVAVLP